MSLQEYFQNVYEQLRCNWNVESSLASFGEGQSNEESQEAKTITRYYVKPYDKRFKEIYLNFDEERNIESIVWFLDKGKGELISLAQLRMLFGPFEMKNVIYDETTALKFFPKHNKSVKVVKTTISEWVEKRKDGTFYFEQENKKIEVNDDFEVSQLVFELNCNKR